MLFEVDRADFRTLRLVEQEPVRPEDGQVRLAVDRFALTANNISYALSGDTLGYWDFFPASGRWGRIPVIGVGTVVESANDEIAVGGRYFGFFPMAGAVTVDAVAGPSGFRDAGAHREGHASIYVSFVDIARDPTFPVDLVDEYLLLRGLYMTSFLIDDFLADRADFGAEQVIVTSASSKTSIALLFCLAARGLPVVGLTSARNRGFVDRLGFAEHVVTYDDIESLGQDTDSVVVDVAGNADVLRRLHAHLGDQIRHSTQVGATHWEEAGRGLPPTGPRPEFFFAPGQAEKRRAEWGGAELDRRLDEGFRSFAADSGRWLRICHGSGPEAVAAAYREVVDGETAPETGHVLSMHGFPGA